MAPCCCVSSEPSDTFLLRFDESFESPNDRNTFLLFPWLHHITSQAKARLRPLTRSGLLAPMQHRLRFLRWNGTCHENPPCENEIVEFLSGVNYANPHVQMDF